jgi:hypothetical protein
MAPLHRDVETSSLAFQHVIFDAHDAHHMSLSVCERSGKAQGRAKWEEGGQRTLH